MRTEQAPGASTRRRATAVSLSIVALVVTAGVVVYVSADRPGVTARPTRLIHPGSARLSPTFEPDPRPLKPAQATVQITSPVVTASVPRGFLGLSTEYWSLPLYERHISLLDRVLSLIHVSGNGPSVLRIGGDSSDFAFWEPRPRHHPRWVFALTPAWLRRTSTVVRRAGVRLILDLNLVTGSPRRAAQWARAAEHGLPRGSIIGFEVGNEPDGYGHLSLLATAAGVRLPARFVREEISPASYAQAFRTYAQALARVAPGVPLAGPALENPVRNLGWISTLIAGSRAQLGIVTAHKYLFSACARHGSPGYPTIARLLGEDATAGVAHRITAAVAVAHRAGLQFRLTELNSVSCGGVPGVSNAFATALWAPDSLFELLRAGVDGVNVHVRTNAVNAAFTLTRGGLKAAPLLYGLILFAKTLSSNPRLVPLSLQTNGSTHLKAWATQVSGGVLHLLVIDKGNRPARVQLQIPATAAAKVERLLAPSASSRSGVTLAGRRLGGDGRWHGRLKIQTITRGVRGYQLLLPAASAALVSVPLAAGAG